MCCGCCISAPAGQDSSQVSKAALTAPAVRLRGATSMAPAPGAPHACPRTRLRACPGTHKQRGAAQLAPAKVPVRLMAARGSGPPTMGSDPPAKARVWLTCVSSSSWMASPTLPSLVTACSMSSRCASCCLQEEANVPGKARVVKECCSCCIVVKRAMTAAARAIGSGVIRAMLGV